MFHSVSRANKRTGDSNQFLLKNTQTDKPSWPGCKHRSYWEVWIYATTRQFPRPQEPTLRCLLSLPIWSTTPFSRHLWPGTRSHPQPHRQNKLNSDKQQHFYQEHTGVGKSPVLLMGQDNFFHSNTVIFIKSITPKSITQKETRIPQQFKLFKQKFQRSQKIRCSEHHCHAYLFEKVFTHLWNLFMIPVFWAVTFNKIISNRMF